MLQIFWPAVENYIADELKNDVSASNKDVYGTLKVYLMMGEPSHRSAEALVDWFMTRWDSFMPQGYTDMNKGIFAYHLREMFSLPNAPVMKMNGDLLRGAGESDEYSDAGQGGAPHRRETATGGDQRHFVGRCRGAERVIDAAPQSRATVTDTAVPGFYTRASYRDVFWRSSMTPPKT